MIKPAVHRFVAAAFAVSGSIISPCAMAGADAVPPTVRQDIENVLKEKNRKLAEEMDNNGIGFKRGTYSKTLRKVDGSTYRVAYFQDTLEAASGNESDQLRTERFELTVKRDRGKWAIAKEEKKDDIVGLYRRYFGVPWIYKFDSLSFEREGLKVSATHGYAYASKLLDAFSGFKVFAADLKFEYAPPLGASQGDYYRLLEADLAKEHPGDLVFKPEWLSITCDPTTCVEFMTRVFQGLKPDTGALSTMREALTEDRRESEKRKKDDPFADLQPPADPGHRYWSFAFKRQGMAEHFARLSYDDSQPWHVSFGATGYGTIFAYYSEDARGGIDPTLLERREDAGALDFDLRGVAGSVDLGLGDDPTAMSGDVTFTLRIKRELTRLPFFIAGGRRPETRGAAKEINSFVNSIQDENGNELTWTRLNSSGGMVHFPEPIPAGLVMKLRIQFTNYDAIYQLNPSFFGLSRQGWLPFVRVADFIDSFDLTVRTRERFTVLGIGKKLSDGIANGIRTTRWTAQKPVCFPTIIFGDYVRAVSKQIVKTSDGTPIPVTVYVDKVSTNALDTKAVDTRGAQGIGSFTEFRSAAASGARDIRGKQLGPIAVQAAVAIDLYQQIFGFDYPYAKLDLVGDPLGTFYGQAPSSIVYLGFGVFRGEGTVAAGGLFQGSSRLARFNRDVVAHETAHQWWGSVVANANDRNYWFIETMAELASALYVERTAGRRAYDQKVAAWRQDCLDNRSQASVQDSTVIWAGDGGTETAANIYAKGPYAFHMFRSTFGNEKFLLLLQEMARALQHKEIVTRDIQDAMERVVGGNMSWFFDQWIRGVGIPQYALAFTSRRNEQGKWIVEGTIRQRVLYGKNREPMPGVFFRGAAPLTFVTPAGRELKSTRSILVEGPETRFRVVVSQEPAKVFFNKDGEILAEDTLIDRSW